jgi:hypothetical protein
MKTKALVGTLSLLAISCSNGMGASDLDLASLNLKPLSPHQRGLVASLQNELARATVDVIGEIRPSASDILDLGIDTESREALIRKATASCEIESKRLNSSPVDLRTSGTHEYNILVSGTNCPVALTVKTRHEGVSKTGESSKFSGSATADYTISGEELSKLVAITSLKMKATSEISTSLTSSKGTLRISGSFVSKEEGTVPYTIAASAEARRSNGRATGDFKIEYGYKLPEGDVLFVVTGSLYKSHGHSTFTYTLNNKTLTPDEAQKLVPVDVYDQVNSFLRNDLHGTDDIVEGALNPWK